MGAVKLGSEFPLLCAVMYPTKHLQIRNHKSRADQVAFHLLSGERPLVCRSLEGSTVSVGPLLLRHMLLAKRFLFAQDAPRS